jgi:hypothetical protein
MSYSNLSHKIRMTIKSERFRNKMYKGCLFFLFGGIGYYMYDLGRPHGTFGQKRMLEG